MEVKAGHGWMSQHGGNHWLPRNPIPSFRMSIFLDVGYPAMASPSAKIPSVGHRKGKTMTLLWSPVHRTCHLDPQKCLNSIHFKLVLPVMSSCPSPDLHSRNTDDSLEEPFKQTFPYSGSDQQELEKPGSFTSLERSHLLKVWGLPSEGGRLQFPLQPSQQGQGQAGRAPRPQLQESGSPTGPWPSTVNLSKTCWFYIYISYICISIYSIC